MITVFAAHIPDMKVRAKKIGFPVFSIGFRPFFALASVWAVVVMAVWLWIYSHGEALTGAWPDTAVWHGHEMVFGYTIAVVAGFLLTAVPNWTKVRPVQAWRLALLALMWMAGRVAMLAAVKLPLLAMAVDGMFLPLLAFVLLPAITHAQSYRNVVFVVLLGLMTLCNMAMHMDMAYGLAWFDARRALYVAVHLIMVMIAVFAGRIVPAFTRNALKVEGMPATMQAVPGWLDMGSVGLVMAVAAFGALLGFASPLVGVFALAAAGFNMARMSYWQGYRTLGMPIVWVLHAGYLALAVGFGLEGVAIAWRVLPFPLALHVLTIGGIGIMTFAMMTRVSLGHSGRKLQVNRATGLAYAGLVAAVAVRVGGGALLPQFYMGTVVFSGLLWVAAFMVFAVVYLPILFSPRADGRPG